MRLKMDRGFTRVDSEKCTLAAKDVLSSSDDEHSPVGEDKGLGELPSMLCTLKQTDLRSTTSDASRAGEGLAMFSSNDSSQLSEAAKSEQPLRFDEELDPPSIAVDGRSTSQERWQRTDAYMRDVQQAFRNRPAVKVQGNERYMKLLLVGEPGLGKDLFIKNMFAAYCEDNDLPVNACPPEATPTAFQQGPSDFCTEIIVDVDAGRTKIHYLVQDTPGTHIPGVDSAILKHIVKQSRDYMAKEEDPRRVVPLSNLPDPRVDAALFFLSPHYLKPQDVELMSRLAKHVPVIPIIAKADALTTAELDEYRQQVRDKLAQASSRAGRPIIHAFTPEELQAAGAVREVPPFAIISSSEVDHEVGSHWFTRSFPWGKCEVMSSNHSDLPALKSLLFECCFEGLKAGTEARFYSARESFLTTRALSKALSSGELTPDLRTQRNDGVAPSNTPFGRVAARSPGKAPLPRPTQRAPAKVAMELRDALRERQAQLMLEGTGAAPSRHNTWAMAASAVNDSLGRGFRKHAASIWNAAAALRGVTRFPQLTAEGAQLLPKAASALVTRTSVLAKTAAKGSWDAAVGAVTAHRTVAEVTTAVLRHRLSRPSATWTRVHASVQKGGSSINQAVGWAAQRTTAGFTSGVGAAKGWAAGVRRGTGSKLTAAFQSYRKGVAAVSEWGATVRRSASAACGRAWGGGMLTDAWTLPKGPLRKVTLGGMTAWGKTKQVWRDSGNGVFNSAAAGRPHWARRLASAFVR